MTQSLCAAGTEEGVEREQPQPASIANQTQNTSRQSAAKCRQRRDDMYQYMCYI